MNKTSGQHKVADIIAQTLFARGVTQVFGITGAGNIQIFDALSRHGGFSGFVKPVITAAKEYGVDAKEIFIELGRRKVVAGQENLIIEIAQEILQRDSTL